MQAANLIKNNYPSHQNFCENCGSENINSRLVEGETGDMWTPGSASYFEEWCEDCDYEWECDFTEDDYPDMHP